MNLFTLYDFLHLLCAVVWIGGGFFMNFVVVPSLAAIEPHSRAALAGAAGKRFAILGGICAILLIVTGFFKTSSHLLANFDSTYAAFLAVKHIVIIVALVLYVLISFVYSPKLGRLAPKQGEPPSADFIATQKFFRKLTVTASVCGILVLFCVAAMRNWGM